VRYDGDHYITFRDLITRRLEGMAFRATREADKAGAAQVTLLLHGGRSFRSRKLLPPYLSTSPGEVMRTQVQPVSLQTRLSEVPGSARL
jgi:hypothetical protein